MAGGGGSSSSMIQMGKTGNDIGKFFRGSANGVLQIGKHNGGAYGSAGTTTTEIYVDGSSNVGIGDNTTIDARLHVKGSGLTNATTSLLVEDSAGADMLSIRDDGAFALGKGASYTNSTPNTSVIIGNSALATSNNSVVIGASATTTSGGQSGVIIGANASLAANNSFGVAIGANANVTGTNGTAIGYSSKAGGNGLAIGRDAEATGSKSITLSASGGISQNTTDTTFDVYMSNVTTPDLKFRTGDNVSYWNPAGETAAFGFSTTSPTATVDINGTFRLRAATNVSNQILTADSNGNATWSDSINVNGQVKGGYESNVTTLAFDWDNGNIQKSSATGAQTFSGANAIAGSTYIIMIGTPTVTWGSSVKWPGATAPILAGTTNIITLLYDGTSYYATSVLNYS